jgi:hypothetical protein
MHEEDVSRGASAKSALFSVMVEFVFAMLPLFVLWTVWPSAKQEHPHSFWQGPEWSMTACILYGLALVRFQQGIMIASKRANSTTGDARHIAVIANALTVIPLFGVIVSVILITKLAIATESTPLIVFQFVNLFLAALSFFIFGGYGTRRFEAD